MPVELLCFRFEIRFRENTFARLEQYHRTSESVVRHQTLPDFIFISLFLPKKVDRNRIRFSISLFQFFPNKLSNPHGSLLDECKNYLKSIFERCLGKNNRFVYGLTFLRKLFVEVIVNESFKRNQFLCWTSILPNGL